MNYYESDQTFIEVDNFITENISFINNSFEYDTEELSNYNYIMKKQDFDYYIYLGIEYCKSLVKEIQSELDILYNNVEKSKLELVNFDKSPIYNYDCTINRYIKYECKDYMNNPLVIDKYNLMITCKDKYDELKTRLNYDLIVYTNKSIESKNKYDFLTEKCQLYSSFIDIDFTLDKLIIK